MSFPEVFEPNVKTELGTIPSKSEMEKVGLGTSLKERNQYRWTGKTYQNINDINYNKFINPKTDKPYPLTETLQNVKEVGSNVVDQVGNVFESKPVQFFLDQTGLNAAEQIFNEGSISAYNFTKQFVPFKSEIKQGASFAATKYEEGITGLSQQLNVHPDITEWSLTALEMFGPGAAKNIAKKKLVSNLNDLTKFVPSSSQVAVAGGGSFNAASIFKSVDTTDTFTKGSITEKAISKSSKIVTEPVGIIKAFPNNPKLAQDAETFVRKAYTYYNTKGQTLKGYGRFVDPNGDIWYMKKQQGAGEAARLSLRKLSRKRAWELTRYGRKAPNIEAIRQALKKHNAEHLLEDLLVLRRKELKLKEASIKKTGKSIGHLKSLAQKGIDVAENIADEAGGLNYARKHLSDLSDIELRKLNVPITWEDYVNLKLPSLLNK